MKTTNLFKTGTSLIALVSALTFPQFAKADNCSISVNYTDGKGRKITLVDEGCDGNIDTGEIRGYNGSRVVLAQNIENPSKFLYLDRQYGEVALGTEVDKKPYQDKFDKIIKGLKK